MVDCFSLVQCLQLPPRHRLIVMDSREHRMANVAAYLLLTKEWSITLALWSIITDPGVPWILFMKEIGAIVVSFDEVVPYISHPCRSPCSKTPLFNV